jgi:hypothetical protein
MSARTRAAEARLGLSSRNRSSSDNDSNSELSSDDLIDMTGLRAQEGPRKICIPAHKRLPLLWTEIEHQESSIAQEVFKSYGPLAVLLYSRIKESKLIASMNRSSSVDFFNPVLSYLQNLFEKAFNSKLNSTLDHLALVKIEKILFDCTPSLEELRIGSQAMEAKEHIVYKIVLDMLLAFAIVYDGPLQHVSQSTHFISLICSWACSLPEVCL